MMGCYWIVSVPEEFLMGRKRNARNRDLPPYLYRYPDGLYLFERPDGRRFSLGSNKARAVRLAVQLNQELRAPSANEEQLLRRSRARKAIALLMLSPATSENIYPIAGWLRRP